MVVGLGVSGLMLFGAPLPPAPPSPEAPNLARIELPPLAARRFGKLRLLATGTPLVGLAAYASSGLDQGCGASSGCSRLDQAWPMAVGGITLTTGVAMLATSAFSLSRQGRHSQIASRVGPVTQITRFGTRTFGFALVF
jgi:hypothetical protein